MKLKKPECAHCGSTRTIKLYWSTANLLRKPMKTHYCDHCAKIVVPGQDYIDEKKTAKVGA